MDVTLPALIAMLAAMTSPAGASGAEQPAVRKYLSRPGFQWTCAGRLTFRICQPPGLKPAATDMTRAATTDLNKILHAAGASDYTGKPLIYIFVLDSDWRLSELLHVSAYGASEPKDHAIFVVTGHPEVLAHELTHEVMANLWGSSEPWITEGFAAKIAGSDDADDRVRRILSTRSISGKNDYIPLGDMVNADWIAAWYPSATTYPELASFVGFLLRTYGTDRVENVWRGGSRSIQRVLGKSLAQLEGEWKASVK
jgi:hypothetical protein